MVWVKIPFVPWMVKCVDVEKVPVMFRESMQLPFWSDLTQLVPVNAPLEATVPLMSAPL